MPNPKTPPVPYGPDNPHPLSQVRTELIWEGKYDEYGKRRPVHLPEGKFPLQRIERIDEPRDREKAAQQLTIFNEDKFHAAAHPDDFRNRLIWGDNKLAMAALLDEFRGQVDLIYIDPPFGVGADFTMTVHIGDSDSTVEKEQSLLEAVAYRDTWGRGSDSYLFMLYERLQLMNELLSERGSLYIHCDWRMNGYIRLLLDDIFGRDNLVNQISWKRYAAHSLATTGFDNITDTIFFYARSAQKVLFNPQYGDYGDSDLKKSFPHIEKETGRFYQHVALEQSSNSSSRGEVRIIQGTAVVSNVGWRWSQETFDSRLRENPYLIHWTGNGRPRYKLYADEYKGTPLGDIWIDIGYLSSGDSQSVNYVTQKPEALLERIIKTSSTDNSIVADFFCGSGTTLAVAEKLGRRWIGVDLGRYAVHTTRKRLIQVQRDLRAEGKPYRPFDVYNLGRYERQWWQMDKLKGTDESHRAIVLKFYKAHPLVEAVNPLLHGKREGALVHVAQIDTVFSNTELRTVAEAAHASGAKELHILAWEYEMELSQRKPAVEAEFSLIVRLKVIPREIMEANRDSIQFFEAGVLTARAEKSDKGLDVVLTGFTPALAEVPEKELQELSDRAVKSPFDFIDFWAVDFDWHPDQPFEHHWQTFRTRKDRSLETRSTAGWQYKTPGKHHICVKVIDVFGVDTTTVLDVEA